MFSSGDENWNPNAAGWVDNYQINLDADIMGAKDMG